MANDFDLAFNPMETITDLRVLFAGLRKRYFESKRKLLPLKKGLPAEIDPTVINAVCLEHFSEQVIAYEHIHLSGWKSTGAYRLRVTTQRGRAIHLVYKDAIYSQDQIPALVGLPVRPGPPEYVFYSQPAGDLTRYLPKVYLAEELAPGTHYRYILEDLHHDYRRGYTQNDILTISALLPDFHQVLKSWGDQTNPHGLLDYGRPFSLALQAYAHASLERYNQHVDDLVLRAILSHWSEIADLHSRSEFFDQQPKQLIHGDPNYTNVHLLKTDCRQMKLVDWEWAGFGTPYSDLVSLLKGTPGYVEQSGFQRYNKNKRDCAADQPTAANNRRYYLWCILERGLLDAGFLANQSVISAHKPAFNMSLAVSNALKDILNTFKQLSK